MIVQVFAACLWVPREFVCSLYIQLLSILFLKDVYVLWCPVCRWMGTWSPWFDILKCGGQFSWHWDFLASRRAWLAKFQMKTEKSMELSDLSPLWCYIVTVYRLGTILIKWTESVAFWGNGSFLSCSGAVTHLWLFSLLSWIHFS